MVKVEDIAVNVLTSVITTLIIIFLLIPLLGIPIPAIKETETVKKYYYPYVMPVELEGDYSTWTEKWEYDFPDGLAQPYYCGIFFSPDYLHILYEDGSIGAYSRYAIIGITDASSKYLSPSDSSYLVDFPDTTYASLPLYNTLAYILTGGSCFSILGKYSLIVLDGCTQFEIWKDGVKTFTSPLASEVVSGASKFYCIGMRYDGKYVLAITDTDKLVCFEGS